MNKILSRLGARIGNWNDRVNATGDRGAEHPRRWYVLDWIAGRLYVRGDRGASDGDENNSIQIVGDTCSRQSTSAGPDFCETCSAIIEEYVKWEGHTYREAALIASLASRLRPRYENEE